MKRHLTIFTVILFSFGIYYWLSNMRTTDTKQKNARQTIAALIQALDMFKVGHDHYPSNLDELVGKYIESKSTLIDPWGHPFVYQQAAQGEKPSINLYSVGPNRIDEARLGDDVVR
jgi:type II secretory pathway pseudopilin PulG